MVVQNQEELCKLFDPMDYAQDKLQELDSGPVL